MVLRAFVRGALRWLRRIFLVAGAVSLLMLALAFTSVPFHAHRWLGTAGGLATDTVDAIVVLSGSGMPSGPELMRCHLAAMVAQHTPQAGIILLLPRDTALERAMREELTVRGVAPWRVSASLHGRNTREQALDLAATFPEWKDRPLALVTAPENMYRSLLAFRKLGFTRVSGAPAFDHALFSDLTYNSVAIGGNRYMPDMARHTGLRYNFWNYLKLEITCLREYAALAYYKLNGWI